MLRGLYELNYLEKQAKQGNGEDHGVAPIPRDGCSTKADQVKIWFTKYKHVMKNNKGVALQNMIEEMIPNYLLIASDGTFGNEDNIPDDVKASHPMIWAKARTMAINEIHEYERTFVVLSPKMGNHDNIEATKPFRDTYSPDKNIKYKWKCTCNHGMKYGHCCHIFVITHGHHDLNIAPEGGFHGINIPASAVSEDLSQPRRRGRMANMLPALMRLVQEEEKDDDDDDEDDDDEMEEGDEDDDEDDDE